VHKKKEGIPKNTLIRREHQNCDRLHLQTKKSGDTLRHHLVKKDLQMKTLAIFFIQIAKQYSFALCKQNEKKRE